MQWFYKIKKSILDFLIPIPKETAELDRLIQEKGISSLTPYREKNGDMIVSLFSFHDNHVRTLIHEIKYRRNNTFADILAPIIVEECIHIFENECIGEHGKPILTWIPTREETFHERGFHQILTLKHAVEKYESQFFTHQFPLLSYTRKQKRQTEMKSREERIANMDHVFTAHEAVKNRIVFLIDDVCTTGSTLLDAKRAFLEKGVRKVFLVSLAR